MRSPETPDYIVVGAGSAGCVVASRLAAAGADVALFEAGGTDRRPDVRLPIGIMSLFATANWRYPTAPDPSKNNKPSAFAGGRIVGGSGSINAMVYVRGRAEDFDGWQRGGATGWSYDDVLPAFRSIENWAGGSDSHRGTGGPIDVTWCGHRHPLDHGFIAAAVEAGYAHNPDQNGSTQLGVGPAQVNQRHGLRCSAATGFLRSLPSDRRPRLHTRTPVQQVLVEKGRAVGIVAQGRLVRAAQGVILAAGAIGSPALLMRSGIRARGRVADLPGVGQNLHDHLVVAQHWASRVPTVNSMNPVRAIRAVGSLVASGTGALTTTPFEAQLFTDEFQIAISPVHYQLDPIRGRARVDRQDAFTVYTVLLQPESRGRIELRDGKPVVQHARLSQAGDRDRLLAGTALARDLIESTSAMRGMTGTYLDGDPSAGPEWLAVKESSIYHAVGTCRMGTDGDTVVDPHLRVHGIEGLRVVDASVMPSITSGNTNAPSMMIAHRAADLVLHG
ncbi:GMC family oxidoreductase [Mycobacterium sp. C31M]